MNPCTPSANGPIDKRTTAAEALADVRDGATILIGGFGESGVPVALIGALIEQGASGLTVISNNAGSESGGVADLFRSNRVAKLICSYPRSRGSVWFERRYALGGIDLEVVPQGTLTERIRAAGAGIPAFYTATGVGTQLTEGKEVRRFGDREYVLEKALAGDVALIRCLAGRSVGQLGLPLGGTQLRPDDGHRRAADDRRGGRADRRQGRPGSRTHHHPCRLR